MTTHMTNYYSMQGKTMQEIFNDYVTIFQGRAAPGDIWIPWITIDIPLTHVPFVLLSELAGVSTPIHKAMIAFYGAILGTDFWKTGLTLDKLGLKDLTTRQIVKYVTDGEIR